MICFQFIFPVFGTPEMWVLSFNIKEEANVLFQFDSVISFSAQTVFKYLIPDPCLHVVCFLFCFILFCFPEFYSLFLIRTRVGWTQAYVALTAFQIVSLEPPPLNVAASGGLAYADFPASLSWSNSRAILLWHDFLERFC